MRIVTDNDRLMIKSDFFVLLFEMLLSYFLVDLLAVSVTRIELTFNFDFEMNVANFALTTTDNLGSLNFGYKAHSFEIEDDVEDALTLSRGV